MTKKVATLLCLVALSGFSFVVGIGVGAVGMSEAKIETRHVIRIQKSGTTEPELHSF